MHQHLMKLFLAGAVAVILTVGPAQALHKGVVHGGGGGPGNSADLLLIQAQLDNLALLASRQASVFVFVTSTTHTGNLGGIADADLICNNLAAGAGLPGVSG